MLNLNCVICAELFSQSDDVHVTHCGHMFHILCLKQWMERSKSCPQCRNKCTDRNIFRVYFNLANLDTSHIDVGSLQEQLDNAMLQVKMKEKEVNVAEEQVKKLKETQKKCMKTISGLEAKLEKNDFIILSYTEQLKLLKTEAKAVSDLREEVKCLKREIATMEGINTILAGSSAEADKLLKTEGDPKKLAVWVTTLKRELRNSEAKKTDLRNVLKVVQKDLRREIEVKKIQEERISQLESDNYQLSEKVKSLESGMTNTKTPFGSSSNACISLLQEERRITISPTIKDNVRKIEESNSPYLNIKSSSIGLMPLFKRTNEAAPLSKVAKDSQATTTKIATIKISPSKSSNQPKELSEKLSIFKKPRLGMLAASASTGALSSNYVSNGFGGSHRIDPFASVSDSEDDMDVAARQRTRKIPTAGKLTSTVSTGSTSSLSSRLKAGGLRNFKVNK